MHNLVKSLVIEYLSEEYNLKIDNFVNFECDLISLIINSTNNLKES